MRSKSIYIVSKKWLPRYYFTWLLLQIYRTTATGAQHSIVDYLKRFLPCHACTFVGSAQCSKIGKQVQFQMCVCVLHYMYWSTYNMLNQHLLSHQIALICRLFFVKSDFMNVLHFLRNLEYCTFVFDGRYASEGHRYVSVPWFHDYVIALYVEL